MNRIIVLGNDHTNTLGIIQALGQWSGIRTAFLFGQVTGIVKSSVFADEIHSGCTPQDCIDEIISLYCNSKDDSNSTPIPIIASCDSAALALEEKKKQLEKKFVFEYATQYSFQELFVKDTQVRLADEAGFNIPRSCLINSFEDIPQGIQYPCVIKPLVSCQGSKSDIRICGNFDELKNNLNSLKNTKRVILQQYIERDYEISILGCGLKNGEVLIPCVENKLTLYPKNVGLECLANMQPLEDDSIIKPIKTLIKKIGYVGPFSVEMMHCKHDGKFYFTEINLRNDGANGFVFKYGVNLSLNHVEDLLDLPLTKFTTFKPGYYIWEMHHTLSLAHRELKITQWVSELRRSQGFLTYLPNDRKPFFKQYVNWVLFTLHLKKYETY